MAALLSVSVIPPLSINVVYPYRGFDHIFHFSSIIVLLLRGNCDLIITVLSVARRKNKVNAFWRLKKLQEKI